MASNKRNLHLKNTNAFGSLKSFVMLDVLFGSYWLINAVTSTVPKSKETPTSFRVVALFKTCSCNTNFNLLQLHFMFPTNVFFPVSRVLASDFGLRVSTTTTIHQFAWNLLGYQVTRLWTSVCTWILKLCS